MKKTIMECIDLCALSYQNKSDIETLLKSEITWIENTKTDTQCFIYENQKNLFIVLRGTEFTNLNDWKTNIDCTFTYSPWGAVHRGFKNSMDSILPDILNRIIDNKKIIIITGHSLGASIAEQLMMHLCFINITIDLICISIAPPRSTSRDASINFGRLHGGKIYHIINNNDIVTRVPTRFMGYEHIFNRILNYLDEDGELHHNISWWERFKDRVKGRLYDFGEWGTDGTKDHLITEYQKIWKNLL